MQSKETDWIDRFIRHLRTERRLSDHTCKHYRRDLHSLCRFCDKQGLQSWSDLDDEYLRAYSAASYRRGLSARSIQRRLSAARTFFRFLLREKWIKRNPETRPEWPAWQQNSQTGYSAADRNRSGRDADGLRDSAQGRI